MQHFWLIYLISRLMIGFISCPRSVFSIIITEVTENNFEGVNIYEQKPEANTIPLESLSPNREFNQLIASTLKQLSPDCKEAFMQLFEKTSIKEKEIAVDLFLSISNLEDAKDVFTSFYKLNPDQIKNLNLVKYMTNSINELYENKGYADGMKVGFKAGHTQGYNLGEYQGYSEGYTKGLKHGAVGATGLGIVLYGVKAWNQ